MTNNTKTQFGIILIALAAIGKELLDGAESPTPAVETPAGDQPRRGRPPKTATPPPADESEPAGKAGLTIEDLKEAVKPLMAEKRDTEVKAAIAKHGSSLSDVVTKGKAEALLADIEALKL